jgi:hypothetical protein
MTVGALFLSYTGTPPAGTGGVQPTTPIRQEGGAMSVPNSDNPHRAHRYSEQSDPNIFLCRDCGSLVKHGYLIVHHDFHDAIGYPDYTQDEAADDE